MITLFMILDADKSGALLPLKGSLIGGSAGDLEDTFP